MNNIKNFNEHIKEKVIYEANTPYIVYILTSDGYKDSANLQKCAIDEEGIKKLLIEETEIIGQKVIKDSIIIDYKNNIINYQYEDDGDIEDYHWMFFQIEVI
jgi:hypothetical protein